jgi:ABC-type nitrate/sulfonate/bicarbonate transport system substrate-binding protein
MTRLAKVFLPLLLAAWGATTSVLAQPGAATVRTSLNPIVYSNLPILIAIEKGYFAAEGIKLDLHKYHVSSVSQMPLLARGDLDITMMAGGPSLFNQRAQGFDIKLIASIAESHAGWHDSSWLIVRQDVWDAGGIRTIADMKGHAVDGGTPGSPNNFLMYQAIVAAGLSQTDLKYTARIRPPDGFAAFRNKAVEVMTSVEPVVSEMVVQGLAARLTSAEAVMPWFQESFFAAPAEWLDKNHATTVGFLKAYLRAAKQVDDNGPRWSAEFADILARWTEIPMETINGIAGPPYYGQLGVIRVESLAKQQIFWAAQGFVAETVDPAKLVDHRDLDEARRQLGYDNH